MICLGHLLEDSLFCFLKHDLLSFFVQNSHIPSLLNTGEEHKCFYQVGVKACEKVHLQIRNKPVALPFCGNGMGSSSTL